MILYNKFILKPPFLNKAWKKNLCEKLYICLFFWIWENFADLITKIGLRGLQVVMSVEFSIFLLSKHFITEFFLKKKSGEVKGSVIFPFYFLLHKRAKPAPMN